MRKSTRGSGAFIRGVVTALSCAAVILWHGNATPAATESSPHLRPIDTERSWLKVYVGKEGLFKFAGDEHQVDVPIAAGSFDDEKRSIEFTIDAAKMHVLDPPSRRDKVQSNMLGPQVLDVAKYPTISFRSTGVSITPANRSEPSNFWNVKGDLTLHGQTHPVSVVARNLGPGRFTGSARLKQSTFGIAPLRVAGGAVRVKDEVDIVFEIDLK